MNQEIKLVNNKDRRDGKGRVIALSRTIYRIIGTDVFYVESESVDGRYYYLMFNTQKEIETCSCKDFEVRRNICKHLRALEYAIKYNTVKETDKLPLESEKQDCTVDKLSYMEDDYGF